MRRVFASFLIISLVAALLPTAFATGYCKVLSIEDFKTNASEFTTDESHDLLFTAKLLSYGNGMADAYVYDDSGAVVAKLNDNGKNGDSKACDGIYSATIKTDGKEACTERYTVCADGIKSKPLDVIYYHMMTAQELANHESFWEEAEIYRQSLRDAGKTPSEVLSAMYDYVKSSPFTDKDSLYYSNSYTFIFKFIWGSTGYVEEYSLADNTAVEAKSSVDMSELLRAAGDEASWTDPDFMVFRPFRQSPNQGDFTNEFYTDIARSVCTITGGEMKDFQEEQAYPGNLKDIDQYGFYIIDSHGIMNSGKSYMLMRKGDTSKYEYAADISAGHIVTSGPDVGVTGSFFTKYIKNRGKSMPDTLLYLVVCYGMATGTICDPVLDCGAQLVFGYTDSVSFQWDFMFSETLWDTFVSKNTNHPERTNTFEEAFEAAVAEHGSIDPYSVGNATERGLAEPRLKGNVDFILSCESYKPVTGFTIPNNETELYTGETERIEYQIISEGYTNCTIAFTSSDESVATVDEEGYVTLVSYAADVKATITATLTDLADKQNPVMFTAEFSVTGKGPLAVEDIAVETSELLLYEGTPGAGIQAHVLPANATDRTLEYRSLDESVATVSESGWVTPTGIGCTQVCIINPGTEKTAFVSCTVKSLTLTEAVNAQGSQIEVTCSENYPFVPGVDAEGNPCAASSNKKKDSTISYFTVSGSEMKEGSYITFEWMVSSERQYDKLCFYANDILMHSISGETDWETYRYDVPKAGEYTFRIAYVKDGQMSDGDDTGYVRRLELCRAGETHTVNFYDMDGTLLSHKVNVEHGASVNPPAETPLHEGYHFIGWSVNTERVLSDLNVYALYRNDGQEPIHVQLGDVNSDGKVNTADAVAVLKYSVGILQLDEYKLIAANVNKDDKVNTADAVLILKFAAEMITGF